MSDNQHTSFGRVVLRSPLLDELDAALEEAKRIISQIEGEGHATYTTVEDVKAGNILCSVGDDRVARLTVEPYPGFVANEVAGVALHDASAGSAVAVAKRGAWSYVQSIEAPS